MRESGTRRDGAGERYPPIDHYGFLSDCHSVALVSRAGSVDWACMPRIDSPTCFARILDWERGGHCSISAARDGGETSRRYLDDSLVLETIFRAGSGALRLVDFFAVRRGTEATPAPLLVRLVEGIEGELEVDVVVKPVFEYGDVAAWIRTHGGGVFSAIGGSLALVLSSDLELEREGRRALVGRPRVRAGERRFLALRHASPHDVHPGDPEGVSLDEASVCLERTLDWWRDWCARGGGPENVLDAARRSAMVIKGLVHAPTGAIAAAATTSLPEAERGERNWDYRYSWLRDSVFAVRALQHVGHFEEAEGFRAFLERTTAGDAREIQTLYGVSGHHRVIEAPIDGLEGHRGALPVRVGNAAWRQLQLDSYGHVVDLAWWAYQEGASFESAYWEFLVDVADLAGERWREPDHGLWEVRGEREHFVHSKASCWSALDRAIRMSEALELPAPVERWARERDACRAAIEAEGRGGDGRCYRRSFGSDEMDSSLLLLPRLGYVGWADDAMVATVDAVRERLEDGRGLLRRYAAPDGLRGREHAFVACTFWLAEALARQGRLDEARSAFRRGCGTANDLWLFAEEYDGAEDRMAGNFPQGLSHYSFLSAAVALAEAEGRGG